MMYDIMINKDTHYLGTYLPIIGMNHDMIINKDTYYLGTYLSYVSNLFILDDVDE